MLRKILFILFLIAAINVYAQTDTAYSQIISITAVGDIMMGTDFPKNRLPANDGADLMAAVDSILGSTDITFGNLEGVLINDGEPKKECDDSTACYFFRTPTKYINNLKEAGFNLMSLGNNHAFDFGKDGYDTTEYYLNLNSIRNAGKEGSKVIWQQQGLTFGFTAFSPNAGVNNLLDSLSAVSIIAELDDSCDVVIVSFHGGAEGSNALHVPDSVEIYYEEKRGNVISFSKAAIDAGADVVLGHGPHVPRAIELYNDRLIAYSLGNFCTYRGFSLISEKGLAPILQFAIRGNGKFLEGKIISARQVRPKGPVLDNRSRAFKLIKKLTLEDIDSTMFNFYNDGSFFKNNQRK